MHGYVKYLTNLTPIYIRSFLNIWYLELVSSHIGMDHACLCEMDIV